LSPRIPVTVSALTSVERSGLDEVSVAPLIPGESNEVVDRPGDVEEARRRPEKAVRERICLTECQAEHVHDVRVAAAVARYDHPEATAGGKKTFLDLGIVLDEISGQIFEALIHARQRHVS